MKITVENVVEYLRKRVAVYDDMLLNGEGGYAVKKELVEVLRMLEDVEKGRKIIPC
jgi:hypothetical protein